MEIAKWKLFLVVCVSVILIFGSTINTMAQTESGAGGGTPSTTTATAVGGGAAPTKGLSAPVIGGIVAAVIAVGVGVAAFGSSGGDSDSTSTTAHH